MNAPDITRRLFLAATMAPFSFPSAMAQANSAGQSLTSEDQVDLFDTAGHLDTSAGTPRWLFPLHGRVYRAADSRVRKGLVARLFEQRYGLEAEGAAAGIFDERLGLLFADNQQGKAVAVRLQHPRAGGDAGWVLPPTAADGHARLQAVVPSLGGTAPEPMLPLQIDAPDGRARPLSRLHLIEPTGLSIISDIDDTVKVTGVTDRKSLWRSTFYEPFKAVPGMADLLRRLGPPGTPVHYVSSSPWHLYRPLRDWLDEARLPVATLHLKQIRLKDRSILNITKSPSETKPPEIAALLRRYPGRSFILVGDSGEQDPEVYAAIARRFSGRIARVVIRRAPGGANGPARFKAAFAGLEHVRTDVFDDPSEVV
jgi:hypothetical protein